MNKMNLGLFFSMLNVDKHYNEDIKDFVIHDNIQ